MCDLLWSDPQPQVSLPGAVVGRCGLSAGRAGQRGVDALSCVSPQNGRSVSKRGVSCQFGPDVTKAFLEENKLDYIIRSHEVKAEGYEVAHGGRCVTVFSAPNYWCVPTPACRALFAAHWFSFLFFLTFHGRKFQRYIRYCNERPHTRHPGSTITDSHPTPAPTVGSWEANPRRPVFLRAFLKEGALLYITVMTTVSPSGRLNPARVPFPHIALLSVSFQLIASKQDPWSASSSSPSVLPSALLVFG